MTERAPAEHLADLGELGQGEAGAAPGARQVRREQAELAGAVTQRQQPRLDGREAAAEHLALERHDFIGDQAAQPLEASSEAVRWLWFHVR